MSQSPSKLFANLGEQLVVGFKVGLMKGSCMHVTYARSKYKLINKIDIPHYLPFGPDKLKEIDKYYDFW